MLCLVEEKKIWRKKERDAKESEEEERDEEGRFLYCLVHGKKRKKKEKK